MQRIGLFCAAFAVAALARPVAAQQAMAEQQTVPAAQSQQAEPPPFPAYPPEHHVVRSKNQAAPSERYPGTERQHTTSKHPVATRQHKTSKQHMTSKHHATSKRHAASKRQATHEHHKAPNLSKRTIRQCHDMSYKQIVKSGDCRALMMSDLEAHEHQTQHSSRHATKHSNTKSHSAKHRTTSTKKHRSH